MNLSAGLVADEASAFAARTRRISPSASNVASQKAREASAAGRSILNLTVGEPDFETPDHIKQAATDAIWAGQTRYTRADGTPEMKDAVAQKFRRENGLVFAANEITVGCGAKHTIFNAFLATVDDGDEVVIPSPYWGTYPEMVRLAGGMPVIVPTDEASGFKITPAQLEEALTERTRWLVINSPGNPAGGTYSKAELEALADVLERFPRAWVLSDDIYEHILYDGRPFATFAADVPAFAHRTYTVNGVSKAYCMTGWRIGFGAGPRALITEIAKIQSQSTSNPCTISQAAAIAALNGPQDHVFAHRDEFARRRTLMLEGLSGIPGLSVAAPEGAFYVFPGVAALLGRSAPGGGTIANDVDVVAHFLDHGVASVPGSAYGAPDHVRLSFAASDETLREGCRRIAAACEALSG
ncbi:pyridoxal phosphate-dependent aminotransferase [Acuticoccus mangrovi]|uniref:aspartate transaminase n=1 Tax=Acuticoccus mangrovi TaxID=2796142 RepID=A0A934IFE4_9HYPH|nr:pyridoxal phosphate-dependent aminotransferase [Acuticoccus mangrovi]MBJ3775639.1 pyridoxal phosphate-dependent aminotransferase [Acuticoccus mangrovi]